MRSAADAASCTVAAGDLRAGAERLQAASGREDADDAEAREASAVASDLDVLARALAEFAVAVRDPAPTRPGRPFPHTALRSVARRIVESSVRPEDPARPEAPDSPAPPARQG